MLVLSRQRDETIMIGEQIEITVVDIRGDKVRLGINAPTTIAVHRKEVYDAIRHENEQAACIDHASLEALSNQISSRAPADHGAHQPTRPNQAGTRGSGSTRSSQTSGRKNNADGLATPFSNPNPQAIEESVQCKSA